MEPDQIRQNYDRVLAHIYHTAQTCGRNVDEINLVVVSKGQPGMVIDAAASAGATLFGENYPEETLKKIVDIQHNDRIQWHMIGHLQSRKIKMVCEYFSMLHSLDSLVLAEKLNKNLEGSKRTFPCLLEVNVSGEESKYGYIARTESDWEKLIPEFEKIIALPNIYVCGLMTMPPYFENPEKSRPYFKTMNSLRYYLDRKIPGGYWKNLSMGTSHDYPVAIEEGATYVRIGTAILGARNPVVQQ